MLYVVNFERCLIFLQDSKDDLFHVQGFDGYYSEAARGAVAEFILSADEPALAPLLSGSQHLLCGPEMKKSALARLGRRFRMDDGFVVLPLVGDDGDGVGDKEDIVGFLVAGNSTEMSGYQTPVAEDSDALVGLGSLASQLSIAIKNARLYARQLEINQELRVINQQLESFAFSAAHTLKTDWQGVGYLVDEVFEILEEAEEEGEEPDLEEITEVLEALRPRTMKGVQTTNDLLAYARMGGKPELEQQSLLPLVEEVVSRVGHESLEIDPDFPEVTLPLDRKTFPVALLQIVENAVTYGEGKPIRITSAGGTLRIRDQGRGIPPESLETIFELFKRAVTDVAGTGVGLAMARQIIMAHGFEVWAESEGEGKGSTFIVNFKGKDS